MQLLIRKCIIKFLRWGEGCSCHESLRTDVTFYEAGRRLRCEISCPPDVPCRCPLSGARAPELAAGRFDAWDMELLQTTYGQFMAECTWRLTGACWERLGIE